MWEMLSSGGLEEVTLPKHCSLAIMITSVELLKVSFIGVENIY